MTPDERLENFRNTKYALYDKTNNMKDINEMNLFEFLRVLKYFDIKSKKQKGGFVPLSSRQKRMIAEAKKNGNAT